MKKGKKDPNEIRLVPKGCNPNPLRLGLRSVLETFVLVIGYAVLALLLGILISGEVIENNARKKAHAVLEDPTGPTIPSLPNFDDSELSRRWDRLK
jgi:hypothetical protein